MCICERPISHWRRHYSKMRLGTSSKPNATRALSFVCFRICDILSFPQGTKRQFVKAYKLRCSMQRQSTTTVSRHWDREPPNVISDMLSDGAVRRHLQPDAESALPSMELRTMLMTTARDSLLSYLRRWRTARKAGRMNGANDSRKVDIVRLNAEMAASAGHMSNTDLFRAAGRRHDLGSFACRVARDGGAADVA